MFNWTQHSSDPNSGPIYRQWKQYYDSISEFAYQYRNDFLFSCLKDNKRILDIGFVEHAKHYIEQDQWFHGNLRQRLPENEIWGVDINAELVAYCQEKFGFDRLICADACGHPFQADYFDVIFAGHVIEHLSDVGLFLKFCSGSLAPGGRLIIATPNPFGHSFNRWRTQYQLVPVNMEHVNWITPSCMNELCRRYNFVFERSIYPKPLGTKLRPLRSFLFSLWKNYRFDTRDLYYDEHIYILKKAS